jgi:hypothetical protein
MATLKCLACGHDNSVGEESCSSCSSSLNLKLCSACEAINANNADRCHSCNAQFRAEPETATPLDADPVLRVELAEEAPLASRALPAVWRRATDHASKRSTKFAMALGVLPLLAAGLAYGFYLASQPAPQPGLAQKGQAPAPAVSGKIAPPKIAPAPVARSAPPPEPKRTAAAITHTGAAASLPVPEVAPAVPERRRVPVTHTKAALTEAAVATTAPAGAAEGRSVPVETKSDETAGCAPAVVALGLCKSR